MKSKKVAAICIMLVTATSSCDMQGFLIYNIKNNCSTKLKVIRIGQDDGLLGIQTDTFYISPKEEKQISNVSGPVNVRLERFKEEDSMLQRILQLDIYKNDTQKPHITVLKRDLWQFEKKSNWVGSYTLTISDTDF